MRIESFDYSINFSPTIIPQYNTATRLQTLINQKQVWYDANHTQFWEDWYTNVYNLITANDFGLCVWSIILDAPYLINYNIVDKPVWGFNKDPSENHNKNFSWGTFAVASGSRIYLTTEDQRLFLRLRYFKLTTRPTIPAINIFLDLLFNDPDGPYQGGAWAIDNLDMSMKYVFNCNISNALFAAIQLYDVLPHPDCVALDYEAL